MGIKTLSEASDLILLASTSSSVSNGTSIGFCPQYTCHYLRNTQIQPNRSLQMTLRLPILRHSLPFRVQTLPPAVLRLTDALDGVSCVLCGPGQWTSKTGSFSPPSPCATKSNKGQKNRWMLFSNSLL